MRSQNFNNVPDEDYAAQVVKRLSHESVASVNKFPIAACHFVYDVVTESGSSMVVRVARPGNQPLLAGSVCWNGLLKPKGIPVPNIFYSDTEMHPSHFNYQILERLPGEDLGGVYHDLSKAQKKALAEEIVSIQKTTSTLPRAKGYGLAADYGSSFLQAKWVDVLEISLDRSRRRMKAVGAVDYRCTERVVEKLDKYEDYFSWIKPRAFLDDTTMKNVIIHNGKLSGIVDIDVMCFGDSLFPIALTKMSLLNRGLDTDYIDFWCDAARLDEEQRKILQIYTALFCVNFMSRLGQVFHKEEAQPVNPEDVQRLTRILDSLLIDV